METVRQEDKRVNPPACLAASSAQRYGNGLAINLVLESRFAPVALIHAVNNRARIYPALTLREMA